jgi:hypothetical protein
MTSRLGGDAPTTKKLGGNTVSMTKGMRTGVSKRSFGQSTQQSSCYLSNKKNKLFFVQ